MSARLLLSVSGVDDGSVDRCAAFADVLAERGVRLSLLVAPRRGGGAGLRRAAEWIVEQQRVGSALVLHGYDHVAPAGCGRRAEFAALPAHEAGLRLAAACAVLERYGLATDVFAPPAWQASAGTLDALRRNGFAVCATAAAVHHLRTGVAYGGRVLGFDGLNFGPAGSVLPWSRERVLGVAGLARRGGLLRLAVDAAAVARAAPRAAVLAAVDLAIEHGAVPATYGPPTDDPWPDPDPRPGTRSAARSRSRSGSRPGPGPAPVSA